jgi:hypothetical protein
MKKAASDKKRVTRRRRARKRLVVPPPDNEVWPPQYRGKRWKAVFGILFAGRCLLCKYSCQQPKSRRLRDKWLGEDSPLLCMNYPDHPGELAEVRPIGTCRNFRIKRWTRRRPQPARSLPGPSPDESDPQVRRIPVGKGYFAIVDAADYEEISKYKWYASKRGRNIYALCYRKGRGVGMHRMVMRARKGQIVDHIDGNGLNNRRSNLRFCKSGQNQANQKPRGGSSQYVGVCRLYGKWQAGITYRGKYLYLGRFDDEIEAAKTRDRKAYELHGEYAYLNFPEDFQR